ncbi:MAG: (2Fe-2S)-binding protein [Devosia sp.]
MDASLNAAAGQEIIDALMVRHGDSPRAIADLREGMLTPLALAGDFDTLEFWLAEQGIADDGMDLRTKAAYMIGGIAWSVCWWMALLDLNGQPSLRRVAIAQERYWWHGAGTSHEYVRYPLAIEIGPGPDHRTMLEELFAPLIAATMVTSGLSPGAQWRIVSDNVARAFLDVGKQLGEEPRAMAIASAILAEGRLANGRTGFVEVIEGDSCEWFVTRGGCCRYYTVTGGEYCTACVLRKPEDQMQRWRAYLASQAPA